MPKNLVIVESPAKARTIERYLGADYRVLASYGHVRDLPENPGKGKFGVDVDHDFAPEYVISDDRRKQVADIAKAARGADMVFLATDLDREGEAIAWHVAEAAHVAERQDPAGHLQRDHRAAPSARRSPTRAQIDMDLVDAQQTRRIVDRLVGYTLSPLLSRKVRGGLSAGRVQSVAVRLVVEREREISAFTAREYWTIEALLDDGGRRAVRGRGRPDRRRARSTSPTTTTAERHRAAIAALHPDVDQGRDADPEALAGAAVHDLDAPAGGQPRLGFSPKRTMSVAQRLYEGVETAEGQVGLITYMRTDSTAIAGVAMGEAREVIGERFGADVHDAQGPRLQDEVEGRPGGPRVDPPDELPARPRLGRRVAEARGAPPLPAHLAARARLADGAQGARDDDDRPGRRRVRAARLGDQGPVRRLRPRLHRGPRRRRAEDDEETGRLPALAEGDATTVDEVTPTQHFTEPPPRFTEATLIKALEEHGIGRPSTYAATISTIIDRGYVRVEERRLHPELVAEIVTDLLVEHFGDYVDVAFTARMEEELDEVARGERAWVPLLRAFYGPLRDRVDEKRRELKRSDFTTEATDEVCSLGHPMVIRLGRNGRFLACSLYPEHKESRPLPGDEPPPQEGTGEVCPKCGEGTLVGKRGRFGPFVGCSRYPDCDYIKKDGPPPPDPLPFEVTCPKNKDGHLVPRRARRTGNVFWGCSNYPRCDFTTNHEPLGGLHDADDGPLARKGDDGDLPRLRVDERRRPADDRPRRAVPGRPAEPRGAGPPGARARRRRAAGGAAQGGGGRAAAAAAAVRRSQRTTTADPPGRAGRRRVSGVAGRRPRPIPPSRGSSAPSPRATPRRTPSAPTRTAVGAYLDWLAARGTDWRTPPRDRPAGLPRRARRGPRALVRRPAAGGHPLVPSLGDAERPRAGRSRGARSRRRACRAGCRASSRSSRSARLLDVVDEDLDDAPPGDDPERAALHVALALRDRALVETAYAAGLRISELAAADLGSLDLRRGEIRVLGKGRKERIGLLGRPARRRARRPTSRTAGRSSLERRHGARRRRRSRSS